MADDPPVTDADPSHGPTVLHWAVVLFVVGHFVVLFVFTVACVVAIVEVEIAGGWSAVHIRGSLFIWISTWLLMLFGAYPLPALAFWRPFLRASVSWLDILRRRKRPLAEADRGREWLYSPWGPWILIVNCLVPMIAAGVGLAWLWQ